MVEKTSLDVLISGEVPTIRRMFRTISENEEVIRVALTNWDVYRVGSLMNAVGKQYVFNFEIDDGVAVYKGFINKSNFAVLDSAQKIRVAIGSIQIR